MQMITYFPDAEHLALVGDFDLIFGRIPQLLILFEQYLHLGSQLLQQFFVFVSLCCFAVPSEDLADGLFADLGSLDQVYSQPGHLLFQITHIFAFRGLLSQWLILSVIPLSSSLVRRGVLQGEFGADGGDGTLVETAV